MRIGILGPISWRTPPRSYGPWEQVVSDLTEGLVQRGVDVTLFATLDSITSARLSGVTPRPCSEDPNLDPKVWEMLHIGHAFEQAGEFDLLHNHFDFVPLTYSRLVDIPIVTTIHGFSSEQIVPAYKQYDGRVEYVSISDSNRHPDLSYLATVYHGIRMEEFPLSSAKGEYLLFFGRIHPDKGCEDALKVAEELSEPIQVAGLVQDEAYFAEKVKPQLDSQAKYIGNVKARYRRAVLGRAKALLHLIHFDEPFGLSVVEAMACGTPVVAYNRGSMPEIIQPEVNGFLIDRLEEAPAAVRACAGLNRAEVRKSVETRFHVNRMVDDYIAVYRQLLGEV